MSVRARGLLLACCALVACKKSPSEGPSASASSSPSTSASVVASASTPASASTTAKPSVPVKPLLFRIASKAGTKVHLFGSVHVANKSFYPLPDKVEGAFTGSKALAVEVHLDTKTKLRAAELVAKGNYTPPDSLRKHISEKTWTLLDGHPKRPLPMALLAPQKPWVVAVMFLAKELERNGLDPEQGIDKHFVDAAETIGKPIKSLETIEDQLGIFGAMPDATQELFLRESLEETDLVGKQLGELTDAWKSGDEAALVKLLATSYEKPEFKTLQKQLIFDRNVRMAKAVEAMLAGKDDVFVVVGVAHLVGEGGVVDLLGKQKLPVERL